MSSPASAPQGVPGGGRDVRWVRLDGLHLTLRFLGPTLDDRIEAATQALRTAAERPGGLRHRDRRRRDLPARWPAAGPVARRARRRGGPDRARGRDRPGAGGRRLDPGREALPAAPDAGALGRRAGGAAIGARLIAAAAELDVRFRAETRRPVREPDRWWPGPVRAHRGGRPVLTPAVQGARRHPGATIEGTGGASAPDPGWRRRLEAPVTAAQRLRLVLALGAINLVLASVALRRRHRRGPITAHDSGRTDARDRLRLPGTDGHDDRP